MDCPECVVFQDLQETKEEEEILDYQVQKAHLESKEKEDLKESEVHKDHPVKMEVLEILDPLDNLESQELLE